MTHAKLQVALIDTRNWLRGDEVRDYAKRHGLTLSDAIQLLVNRGLSHMQHNTMIQEDDRVDRVAAAAKRTADSYHINGSPIAMELGDAFTRFANELESRYE